MISAALSYTIRRNVGRRQAAQQSERGEIARITTPQLQERVVESHLAFAFFSLAGT